VLQFVLEQRDNEGVSILYTSHNMAEVAEVCDRVLFMQNGKIIADDVPDRLAKSVGICKVTLQVGDGLKRTLSIAKALDLSCKTEHRSIEFELDEEQIAILLSVLAQAGVIYTHIDIRQPTLEDYFLHIAEQGKAENSS
jgi:ABC-2 type transport system ATP-binding protein